MSPTRTVDITTRERLRLSLQSTGFDAVRFARAEELTAEMTHFSAWIDSGHHGAMTYMERNAGKRLDVRAIVPDAATVIVVALSYHTGHAHAEDPSTGKISRYAWGNDYHDVMDTRLDEAIGRVRVEFPDHAFHRYADTGPVLEKAWAVRSGLGWQGKNSNILSRDLGSYFFLGVIITTLDIPADAPVTDHCGTCTACLDACPTRAIIRPAVVDARRCLSYWTIETKGEGEMPQVVRENLDGWLFGCDVCQEVCPWNRFAVPTRVAEFTPRNGETSMNLDTVKGMDEAAFRERFKGSPVKRTKLRGLQRNARELSWYYRQHEQHEQHGHQREDGDVG
ncbi:MAG: tRNA epoxyqueuosine(34) reductase QueG [Candidatus Kapaibacterium sp.]